MGGFNMVTQKEIFYQYLLNKRDSLEIDLQRLQQQIRYRNVDVIDCLELILAMERLNSFCDYFNHAVAIFGLSCPTDYEANLVKIDFSEYRKAAEELRKAKKLEKVGK
jgi:hypothetical protein